MGSSVIMEKFQKRDGPVAFHAKLEDVAVAATSFAYLATQMKSQTKVPMNVHDVVQVKFRMCLEINVSPAELGSSARLGPVSVHLAIQALSHMTVLIYVHAVVQENFRMRLEINVSPAELGSSAGMGPVSAHLAIQALSQKKVLI